MQERSTVAIGMSGGVDSSLAALLLKEAGYNVIGITMKHWGGFEDNSCTKESKTCCSIDDVYDAKRVCDDLEIPHYTVNFEKEFNSIVINNFINEYKNGRTPNPCMICNRMIKMGALIDFAKTIGAEYFATGHYAVVKDGNLYRGVDDKKDQAYFLAQIKKEYLKRIIFPLGGMTKLEVRKMAEEKKIRVYSKRDSQEICFIENDDYKSFLLKMTNNKIGKPGNIVNREGKIMGKHQGTPFYTIGQRKGLGISHPISLYVLGFNLEKNEVIVGYDEELFTDELRCKGINLLGVDNINELHDRRVVVKTRSRDKLNHAKLYVENEDCIYVRFDEAVRAATPGQGAVFYSPEDGLVLGSGYING